MRSRPDSDSWLHEAKQDRSQATTDRILGAALEVFGDARFDSVPVADLARRAGVSVGGFYARFKNKDALLHALDTRLLAEIRRSVDLAMDAERLRGAKLADVVETYIRNMMTFFGKHRHLVREIVIRARSTDDQGFVRRMQEFNEHAHGLFAARLLERHKEIRHDDPERAIAFAILMTSAACREQVLFGDRKMNLSTARGRELLVSLVRAFLAYLGAPRAIEWRPSPQKKTKS